MPTLLHQSIYRRLADSEEVNDAGQLTVDPVMRANTGKNENWGISVLLSQTISRALYIHKIVVYKIRKYYYEPDDRVIAIC